MVAQADTSATARVVGFGVPGSLQSSALRASTGGYLSGTLSGAGGRSPKGLHFKIHRLLSICNPFGVVCMCCSLLPKLHLPARCRLPSGGSLGYYTVKPLSGFS